MERDELPGWLLLLHEEDLEFLRKFLLASGSLKELAKQYGISYPTVRLRLDRLIAKVEVAENHARRDPYELKIAGLVADGELSMRLAKKLLEGYRRELHRRQAAPASQNKSR